MVLEGLRSAVAQRLKWNFPNSWRDLMRATLPEKRFMTTYLYINIEELNEYTQDMPKFYHSLLKNYFKLMQENYFSKY